MQEVFTPVNIQDGVIAFIKKGADYSWYCCSVDHWIMTYWQGYADAAELSIEDAFYDYISPFKVSFDLLHAFFSEQVNANDYWGIRDNLPGVYIDFDQHLFLSTFYDIPLENKVLESWTGKYIPFDHLIPEKEKYWIIDGKDWMVETFQERAQ